MDEKTPWQILGISEDADKKEIRKAYRRLAKKYHPDRNPGNPESEERFKEVQRAYEMLLGRTSRGKISKPSDFPGEGINHSVERDDPFPSFFSSMRALFPQNSESAKPPLNKGRRKLKIRTN